MSSYDLAVLGAGPAGSATAISAASSGAKVLLLERGRFPRHKVCGEFVSAESLDILRWLLSPADQRLISQAPQIQRSRIFLDGAELSAEVDPAAASISRFDLDAALWRSCLAHGIDARENSAVQSIEGRTPFVVHTQSGQFEPAAVVNATGRWSNLTPRRIAGRDRCVGLKAHFCEANPSASVDLYFFDGGYCGVQPVATDAVNVCAMVSARVATNIDDLLRLHPALAERSHSWRPLMQPVTTSPLIFHQPEPLRDGVLQVGDAATFVDPFVGDGISLALRSGVLAAQCLAPCFTGRSTLEQTGAEYAKQYHAGLAHVFRASSALRRFLDWPALVRRPILGFLKNEPAFARRIVAFTR